MAEDRTRGAAAPSAEMPEASGQVRPLTSFEVPASLTSRLVPIVDRIRQLSTRFGARPYRVFLVHLQWPGTSIGLGEPQEISRREVLPTPRLRDLASTSEILRPFGLGEEGGVVIDQVSAKYAEDDLMGRTPDLVDPVLPRSGLSNREFFWEVVENRPTTPNPVPRRYIPNAAPTLSRDGFQWRVSLTKQDLDRSRQRTPNRREM